MNHCFQIETKVAEIVHSGDTGIAIPFVLNRKLRWNGELPEPRIVFNINIDGNWRMMRYEFQGLSLYMGFNFIASKHAFIIFTMYVGAERLENNFRVRMYLEEENTLTPTKLTFVLNVFSIEELQDLSRELPSSRYHSIPYNTMRTFFSYNKNEEDANWTVSIPVGVEAVTVSNNGTQA